jgi:hypothetical protein
VTAGAYPRKRVEDVLIKGKLPASYRIIPRRHMDTPLGVEPADSRFCTQSDGYARLSPICLVRDGSFPATRSSAGSIACEQFVNFAPQHG